MYDGSSNTHLNEEQNLENGKNDDEHIWQWSDERDS